MTAVERLLSVARAEIGYLEKASNSQLGNPTANPGNKNYTKYADDLDETNLYNGKKNGYDWCDIFVDWCFVTAFGFDLAVRLTLQPLTGCGAGCTYSAQYYKDNGQFFHHDPQPGDQIFFTKNAGKTMYHTGIVEKVENGRVYTIEGNTSSEEGVVENGGCVRNKSYSLLYSRIGGYGRPDYSIVPEELLNDTSSVQQKFNDSWIRLRKEWQDNDAGAWSQKAREWAVATGLIAGSGSTPEGQPNYMWEDMLTREQAAMMFYRFATMLGKL